MLEEQNRIEEEKLQEEKRKWEEMLRKSQQRKATESVVLSQQPKNQYDELLDMEEQAWKEKRRQEEMEWANRRRQEEEKFKQEQRQRKERYSTLSDGIPESSSPTNTSQVLRDLSAFGSIGRGSNVKPPSQSSSDPNVAPKYGSFGKNTFKRGGSRDLDADILSSLDPAAKRQEEERRERGKDIKKSGNQRNDPISGNLSINVSLMLLELDLLPSVESLSPEAMPSYDAFMGSLSKGIFF
jgi:hypothetical protein